jgi:ABC-2 type transport system ATP-binding protein
MWVFRAVSFQMKVETPKPTDAGSPGNHRPPALIVEHLTKRFGARTAFEDVSFSVAAGEVFGFLGPNGAGKTTMVRTLGTLIAPTSGSAVVAGIRLTSANGTEIRQHISVMPENPGLYLRLTVIENLQFFARLYGQRNPGARIGAALEAVNLAARGRDLCGSLSKGLRQRVGLARALLNDPAVMFLDEPTSGLDPVATHEVHDLINSLRQRGVSIFLTTHRLEEAERLCDRVAILNTTLRSIGRTEDLRESLFSRSLLVETAAPLQAPDDIFSHTNGVESWRADGAARYVLYAGDPRAVAPLVTRALAAADADVVSISESRHSFGRRVSPTDRRGSRGGCHTMNLSIGRIAAVLIKEVREYRRSPFIVGTMLVLPLLFLIEPTIVIFRLGASVPVSTVDKSVGATFLLLLITPVLIPAVIAAYSVVGEREQGTLEPLLTTPVSRGELLLGKAVGIVVPAVLIAYVLFAIIEIAARLFARNPEVAVALSQGPHILAEALFAPLLAGWSIWVGIGISARSSDVRVAQQLGTLGSVPPLAVVALVSFNVFTPSFAVALAFALGLLVADVVLWRIVSAMFDRERLITGIKHGRSAAGEGGGSPIAVVANSAGRTS